MGRYRKGQCFDVDREPRYIILWNMFWECLEFEVVPPMSDLQAALRSAIARLCADVWFAEGDGAYGSVFLRRAHDRRLLILTKRHPHDDSRQAFSPYR